jgi:hypothetical protein
MTDRLKGFTVALTTDIREDDAQAIADAIRQLRGVLDVAPILADSSDWINRQRIRAELSQKLFDILKEDK